MNAEFPQKKCACGHMEDIDDIYSVSDYKEHTLIDICGMCWTNVDLTETPNSSLSNFKFTTKEEQDRVIKT